LWDNPFASFPGADTERTAVEPDNSFQQVSLSGTYRADAWDTIVAVSLATGRGEQDANLLPYTSNPNLASPLPRTSLDGKVDTSNYALTITASPFAKARVKLAYRYDDRNNKTPVSDWSRVITDSFVSGDTEENVPYSFQRSRLNLSGSYRLFDTVTLLAGYDRTALDRDYQEVASQTEDEGWGKLRWKPTPYLEASFRGGASNRDIGKYDTDVAMTLDQNPLMRKYNLAYRFREFGEVSLNASLPKYPLSVGMTWFKADDNYTHSELGMTESQEDRYSFDFSWAFNKKTSVYLSLGNETIDAEQVGSETFSGPMWTARHKDDFQHYGGGVTLTGIADKFDLTVDFGHGEGETRIRYTEMVVVPEQLPKLTSDIDTADVTATYHHSERLSFEFAARYENLDVHDWALDGVRPDTIPTVLTMGARAYDYNIWAFGISAHYRTQ
jgi:MtrB/PioB family decaheme-associated outer membrane protein